MTLISAHRCGAGDDTALENTRIALERALDLDVDYVEFDVQRCAGDVFVLYHDDAIVIDGAAVPLEQLAFEEFARHAEHYLRYDEVLAALAGRAKAHIDLKFVSADSAYADPSSTHEVAAVRQAIEIMGADDIIVTTLEDQSVAAVRQWSRTHSPGLLVGLSLGRDVQGRSRAHALRTRLSEVFPRRRIEGCGANLVVVNRRLARLRVAAWARRRGLPVLVWTVDAPEELAYWLQPGRAWLVTTNHPGRALAIRQRSGRGSG